MRGCWKKRAWATGSAHGQEGEHLGNVPASGCLGAKSRTGCERNPVCALSLLASGQASTPIEPSGGEKKKRTRTDNSTPPPDCSHWDWRVGGKKSSGGREVGQCPGGLEWRHHHPITLAREERERLDRRETERQRRE